MLIEEIKKRKKDDPLSSLYQLDEDRYTPSNIELTALSNILDNVEKIEALEDTLKEMIIADEVAGLRILNQLEHVIQGIKKGHIKRANKEWRHKFLSVIDLFY